jgi:hypothetical protein
MKTSQPPQKRKRASREKRKKDSTRNLQEWNSNIPNKWNTASATAQMTAIMKTIIIDQISWKFLQLKAGLMK